MINMKQPTLYEFLFDLMWLIPLCLGIGVVFGGGIWLNN